MVQLCYGCGKGTIQSELWRAGGRQWMLCSDGEHIREELIGTREADGVLMCRGVCSRAFRGAW